jgi:hypothetical protein
MSLSPLGSAERRQRIGLMFLRAGSARSKLLQKRQSVSYLPYQLIHRTASVCCVDRRRRIVVYQVFGESPADYYAGDLRRFAAATAAPDRLAFVVLGCACRSTDTYARLEGRWDAGERDLGDDVSEALLAGPLLEFSQPVAIPIQPAA